MKISINNHPYEAKQGERLLDIARSNHEHIGYFCGGNSICQTCYVKILEGSELLSPISVEEKALLSDTLIHEGTRMACLTTVEKEGTIRVVSLVEEVKRVFETNPLKLTDYAAKMGWESLVKFPDTMRMQGKREFDLWQLIADIISGIGDALQLLANAFIPVTSGDTEHTETCKPFQLSAFCNGNTDKESSEKREHIAA
ncbi:MAG: (2Fe-2S)-binding protein [Chlorobiaceae bacterium]|nr:(2Fe-2S)-binding protein [Chlorobiaceae bacterium]